MSGRRKDMWKLLYRLVHKNETELNEVFSFVDDILCKEPSLIRPYSLKPLNNCFQETFIIWLINKFTTYLNESLDNNDYHTNVQLQKRILSSCLVNRSLLFKKLVTCYTAAIEELAVELPSDPVDCFIDICAFNSSDEFKEIDTNASFPPIKVCVDNLDDMIEIFLKILHHALSIGYAFYPELFIDSLASVFKAFKECGVLVKLQCLSYCHTLFKSAIELSQSLDYYYQLTISALAVLWEQIPVWIQVNCVQSEELEAFADISVNILDSHQSYLKESGYRTRLLNLGVDMLICVTSIVQSQQYATNFEVNLTPLQQSLTTWCMECLDHGEFSDVGLSDDRALSLFSFAKKFPFVLRIIGTLLTHPRQELTKTSFHITQQITRMLGEPLNSLKDCDFLKELLYIISFVERERCRQTQRILLNKNNNLNAVVNESNILVTHLFEGDRMSDKEKIMNTLIETFLQHAQQTTNSELYCQYLQIVGILLSLNTVKRLLRSEMLQRLLVFVEKPLKEAVETMNDFATYREVYHVAIQTLSNICLDERTINEWNYLINIVNLIVPQLFSKSSSKQVTELRNAFLSNIDGFILNGSLTHELLIRSCMSYLGTRPLELPRILKSICCTGDVENCFWFGLNRYSSIVGQRFQKPHEIEIICTKCSQIEADVSEYVTTFMEKKEAFIIKEPKCVENAPRHRSEILGYIRNLLPQSLLCNDQYSFILHHFDISDIPQASLDVITRNDIGSLNMKMVQLYIGKVSPDDEDFLPTISHFILSQTKISLENRNIAHQLRLLELISYCGELKSMSEPWLFHFFKETFFFLVHPDSLVTHEAILCATEMCSKHNVKPTQLWHWYKRDSLSLIVKLAVYVYLLKGVRITRSLKAFTKMLGFSCVQEFICKYYRLLTTMILPYCVKEPRCKGLIVCISKITRKPISQIFIVSFLRIYSHIYLTEEASIGNQCIDLIVKCTAFSLKKLMNSDVKQTVSEFLIYFNRNPQFVMQAFQCLLLSDTASRRSGTSGTVAVSSSSSTDFAKFIADRFLGVITYFETCLGEPNFEKPLKEEALYSLGQIIRFVGANNVTQFRFKIIAMLTFVLTMSDKHLVSICLRIWKIFLNIVDIQELGPSLSRIVACLLPLLKDREEEVNSILEFIILKNDYLLNAYIPDLYFIENIPTVTPAIRQCVARQMDILTGDRSLHLEKLQFLFKQITNENVQVRIYGLTYLSNFIADNREAFNRMILGEISIDPLMQQVVDILVAGCRHEDRNLQLASAKCLGELGAVDPSYMSSNQTLVQANEISLSIHSDEFAVMALKELCRAYQFQKDSKYVDNFSLAIQETLLMCGVSPKDREKMNVWEAIPERMRQIMEPLLSSCYTGSFRESKCKEHPIFNSTFCRSYEDWAFAFVSRLIDFVQVDDTKHLLNSYKPSIKRDSNTLGLLFPYIVVHALQDCNESQMQQIFEEFEAVLKFSSRGLVSQPEYNAAGLKEFTFSQYSGDRNVEVEKRTRLEKRNDMENISLTCTKLCSEQIDFLRRWLREWQRLNIVDGKLAKPTDHYKHVETFVNKFDKNLIAKANYHSGEYARALMYLEAYIEEDAEHRLQDQLSFLVEIHGKLMDADSVDGAVYMKKSTMSLPEEILVNGIVDRPQETIACYEQLMSSDEQIHQDHIKGMINCYLRMDVPETALLIADGLWQKLTDHYTDDYFKECKSELLWRLCRYDELQEILEDSVVQRKTTNWNIQCAKAFLLFRQPELNQDFSLEQFTREIDNIRSNILSTMRTVSGVMYNSYSNSYDDVIKLHLLTELEKCKILLCNISQTLSTDSTLDTERCFSDVLKFFADWDARVCILQPIVRVMEPILCFRRNLLIETKRCLQNKLVSSTASGFLARVSEQINNEIGKLWIRSVQMNRDSGNLQQAHLSMMKAEEYEPKMLFLEKAKLLWDKGDQTNCFKLIEENLERIESKCQNVIRNLEPVDRSLYAEAKFLQATFNAESMNICAELNLRYFREAINGNKQSEKCYVHLAQYIEKIYESFSREQKDGANGLKLLLDIMLNYAKSLKYGFENVYQSMPRLLSLWLDFTSRCSSISDASITDPSVAAKRSSFQDLAKKMNDLITNCSSVLPVPVFYTAFSQLLSRICHPSNDVFNVLRTIMIKLVEHYPHQSLWMLLPILKSSYTTRVKRCRLIFTDSRLAGPSFQKLLTDFNMLTERLIELTNKDVPISTSTYELSTLVKQLPTLLKDPKFSEILLPFEKYMQVSLPISSSASMSHKLNVPLDSQESSCTSSAPPNPFPYKQIYITGIREEVTVLRSAARPKKITIECNDGMLYEVMVKPKDDLRKDFRLMEFNGLVKRFLHQDSQARHRHLHIRTYAAIPFNEECGLVEWLPKLNSFRNICTSIYRIRGLGIEDRNLRKFALPKTDPIEKKRSVFVGTLLAQHPPVFHEWFRQRFPTPHCWYEARTAYVKTIAVMSMVGYILGLGDRHGENVLFDETNGDAVHVDFNCLFNQGESFAYPELVPFRLTHNMVFAMGPLGVEGMYRKCCEITLRLLKKETKTLMSVLRPFVYDLVALNRSHQNRKTAATELTDPKAMSDVRRIEERLQGYVNRTIGNSIPLSTEGQVNFLIAEATNIDNLAAMYIGWGSYI